MEHLLVSVVKKEYIQDNVYGVGFVFSIGTV